MHSKNLFSHQTKTIVSLVMRIQLVFNKFIGSTQLYLFWCTFLQIDFYFRKMADENIEIPNSKKRIRRPTIHKKYLAKQKVQKGLEHFSRNGNLIPAKTFNVQTECKCNRKCSENIDVQRQYEIFRSFYGLSNKTLFLRGCVSRTEVKNRSSQQNPFSPSKVVLHNYTYKLLDANGIEHEVCKFFFCKCLQISDNRANRAFDSITTNPSAIDHRGRAAPSNKVDESDVSFVKQFINKFPRYRSHYCRNMSDRYYLMPGLNLSKIYREYALVCDFEARTCVTEHMFRDIFNTKFNLHFKRPKTDTCKTCDGIKAYLENEKISYEDRMIHEEMLNEHHDSVARKKEEFDADVKEATDSNGQIKCFTFDLQKTLETPSLSTSVAYYKRVLWTLNLCIYDEVNKKGYMYMWSEDMASRGADDIGSCVIKHLQKYAGSDTKKVILYSDACGGQNRNIKITLLLKKVLSQLGNIDTITQKYFISGHSYNNCDSSFALIERQRTVTTEVYIPRHWFNIAQFAKKKDPKFDVIPMAQSDFVSSNTIVPLIVNRKVTTMNTKISWLNLDSIENRKNEPFKLFVKQRNGSTQYTVNLHKNGVTKQMFADMIMPIAEKKLIDKKKYLDLMALLEFVPAKYHEFYKNLEYKRDQNDDIDDFGLASDGEFDESDEETCE